MFEPIRPLVGIQLREDAQNKKPKQRREDCLEPIVKD